MVQVFCDELLSVLWFGCSVVDYYPSYCAGVLWLIITHLIVQVFCDGLLTVLRFGCSVMVYYPSYGAGVL